MPVSTVLALLFARFVSFEQLSAALSVALAAPIAAKFALICVCASALMFGRAHVAVLPVTVQLAPDPETVFKVKAGAMPLLSVRFSVQLVATSPALRMV